ncbi:MAG TPA: bifunctional hydroxymethylpyrimidine kinase/phosphomethylpyrimidine kinase [Blastocatellia bacterium]|nr:bifunctional hydroxymethylpyrimidine kinase/phosphomethylpyrimidine kinase [Blastocatellia bacterium]HMV85458.1 bifunctional hydroxymethylpyrimidine kinase/phosphomethylpyrimidine kinase [Blastocatellia bacterium]HMX26922.1 bifunctional hydroxymethylpyrimidine kinase/phosphomethylpyrimidine kinase [Blastocatellia bacterium]HMY70812.1 bifunctional hydroxymethylpyrimidine kinase/phosphomethylpyrimidine kinase [Blastocatellia bacterium]HMZ17284.1 bifunctional hydroxymethylpyrimidine kinase/phos
MLVLLSIAGFDPSSGAGVLADIKTFAAFGCFGTAAVTSLTFQNTTGVYGAFHQSAETLRAQIEPLVRDFRIAAVKIGMLPTLESMEVVADVIDRYQLPNVVVDTVLRSSSGYDLVEEHAIGYFIENLLPLANVVTPNLAEASRLTGFEVKDLDGMKSAARRIHEMCLFGNAQAHRAVLVKGGHLAEDATDVLFDGQEFQLFSAGRIETNSTHGTGCTLSSAIAASLAGGCSIPQAVAMAKRYLEAGLRSAPNIGHGAGPLNHAVAGFEMPFNL